MVTFLLIEAVALLITVACIVGILHLYPAWISGKRKARGECPICAYCLTGNLSGVCPECGEEQGDKTR